MSGPSGPAQSPATTAASDFAIDTEVKSLKSVVHDYVAKLKGGDLGALPALLSIALLLLYFSLMRPNTFVSTFNAANLIQQGAWIVVIAMGITFVLLLGEIDLAAGYVAGVSAAVVALVLKDGIKIGPFEDVGMAFLVVGALAVVPFVATVLHGVSTGTFILSGSLSKLARRSEVSVAGRSKGSIALLGFGSIVVALAVIALVALLLSNVVGATNGWLLLVVALVVGASFATVLGLFTGFLVARVGIPSFVVTLANFLSFQGIILLLAREGGTIRITDEVVLAMANGNLSRVWSWVFCVGGVAFFAMSEFLRRARSGSSSPLAVIVLRVVGVAAIAVSATAFFVQNRAISAQAKPLIGIPYAVPIVLALLVGLTFLLTRTTFGRHLYAVGGSAEAARRAGIDVRRIKIKAFIIGSLVAAVGGLFIASRLASVSPQTGGNDTLILAVGAAVIGGTSLFGGKGRMLNALLGGIVIALIRNGLPLIKNTKLFGVWSVNFSEAGPQFIVAGLVLLASASVDALSRKRTG